MYGNIDDFMCIAYDEISVYYLPRLTHMTVIHSLYCLLIYQFSNTSVLMEKEDHNIFSFGHYNYPSDLYISVCTWYPEKPGIHLELKMSPGKPEIDMKKELHIVFNTIHPFISPLFYTPSLLDGAHSSRPYLCWS